MTTTHWHHAVVVPDPPTRRLRLRWGPETDHDRDQARDVLQQVLDRLIASGALATADIGYWLDEGDVAVTPRGVFAVFPCTGDCDKSMQALMVSWTGRLRAAGVQVAAPPQRPR